MPGTDWRDRVVLVTGVTGFIGTAVARRLLAEGAKVVGLVKEINAVPSVIDDCRLVLGDICNYDTLCGAISYYEVDTIFHFAANAIVRSSSKDPMFTYRTNVMGTVTLLEAARNVGRCKNIVVASSDKAYGDHDVLPYLEHFALQPKNTYDTSKACMDLIARSYAHNYSMPVSVTRCSNVYGPGDMNLSRIVPNTIKRVLDGKPPQVYTDVSDMEREFIYIDDVVDAYLGLVVRRTLPNGRAFNIGGTGPTRIYDLVDKISKIMGMDEKPIVLRRDISFKEIQRQYIDASRLLTSTGWKSKVDLDEGLKRTVEWYKAFYLEGEYR